MLFLMCSWSVPLNSLNLSSCRVASTCKVVVTMHARNICAHRIDLLRLYLILVYFFKQTLLLPLVVAYVKRITSILLCEYWIRSHYTGCRRCVIIGAWALHVGLKLNRHLEIRVYAIIVCSTKTICVINCCLTNFLARTRLSLNCWV